jgi:alpha-D-xyloside xylohydrolase
VYLPRGEWIDYQSNKTYSGGWQRIEAGAIPAVMLVREGAVIPHMKLAQSTAQMDWGKLDLVVFGPSAEKARGLVCLPSDTVLRRGTASELAGSGATVRMYGQYAR